MRYLVILIAGLLLVLAVVPLLASPSQEVCERVVQTALEQANQVCTGTERNQACYGHVSLEAQPQSRFEPFKFNEAGDIINVTQLKTLRLSPMNVATGSWGVAMLKLQANLSKEIPSQNVTLVLFGDVEINNAINAPIDMNVTITSAGNANVRREPSNTGFVLGTLPPGQVVTAVGRNEDSSWVYVDYPDFGERGWIDRRLVNASDEIDTLNVINPSLLGYGPMQAFYVRTGDNSSTCEQAPSDGLLIQTPEGAGEVRLWINEVKIRLGSTVFIQAHPNESMTVSTLEGAAHVEAFGVEQTASAGTTVTVAMDTNSKASAPPSAPQRYTNETVNHLPVDNLEEQITVMPPASVTANDTPTQILTNTPVVTISTSTQVPVDTPTGTLTTTSPPPSKTSTPIPTTVSTNPPTDVPTSASSTDVPNPVGTEEATETVSQTQETSDSQSGSGRSSQTPPPIETPSRNSRPPREPTNSDTTPTDEATAESSPSTFLTTS